MVAVMAGGGRPSSAPFLSRVRCLSTTTPPRLFPESKPSMPSNETSNSQVSAQSTARDGRRPVTHSVVIAPRSLPTRVPGVRIRL